MIIIFALTCAYKPKFYFKIPGVDMTACFRLNAYRLQSLALTFLFFNSQHQPTPDDGSNIFNKWSDNSKVCIITYYLRITYFYE